jgi:hypothetical protein
MVESSLPRDDHFDEVLRAAERLPASPSLPSPIARQQHFAAISEPPPYVVLGVLGVTIRVIGLIEMVIGALLLLIGVINQETNLMVGGLSMILGSVFVYALGESIKALIVVAQNSHRQTSILERQFGGR